MTIATISLDFLWAFATGTVIWLLIAVAAPRRVNPILVIAIITVLTFVGSMVFGITSGLSFIVGTGVVALVNGIWTLFTLPFILATFAIALAVISAVWAFVVRTAEAMT